MIGMNVRRLDPFAAFLRWAVDPVLGVVLLVFAIPQHLELEIEKLLNMLQGYMVISATFRRHHSWVFDRHLKHVFQTVVAHSVSAGQLYRLVRGNII